MTVERPVPKLNLRDADYDATRLPDPPRRTGVCLFCLQAVRRRAGVWETRGSSTCPSSPGRTGRHQPQW